MKQHVPFLLILFSIAAAPTTKPADPFEAYSERLAGTTLKFEMLPIPAGNIGFSLNGKPPFETVQIKRFWIAKTECTWDDYDLFFDQLDLPPNQRQFRRAPAGVTRPTRPFQAPDYGFGHAGFPVMSVTPHNAKMYCQWLSQKTGRKYRLPTPAEWEYACRAGGDSINATDDSAWTKENSDDQTQAVAKKKSNSWGLYDMLGNVAEWTTTADGKADFLCGGHFLMLNQQISSSTRDQFNAAGFGNVAPNNWWLAGAPFCGFRVVREEQ